MGVQVNKNDLVAVVADKGGISNPQLDEEIFPLELTDQQRKDLIVFLEEAIRARSLYL
jgi:hypothetical protein